MKIKRFDGLTLVNKREVLRMYALSLRIEIPAVRPSITVKLSFGERPFEVDMLKASAIAERAARGDKIFAAYHQGIPVAYLFTTTRECRVGEIDDWLEVKPNEVYLYDAYTRPSFRGKRIYPFLITKVAEYYRNEAFDYAMIFSTENNASSNKGIERCGFNIYETVYYRNFLGWKSWQTKIGERHVGSRLRIED
ncbi:MAG: GNAT family N-acetyltransferase [candidate division WOR-3 bacterium]|nr:MAG: GNAT family N-acetyltransferase [candidate division WOR-3 bacterium]